MSRRRFDAGKLSISRLTTCLLLLPWVLAKPQHDSIYESQSEDGQARDQSFSASSLGRYQDGSSLDGKQVRHVKESVIESNRESAIATLAPAANQAVRAPRPAQGTGKSAGLSSLLNARSLQDWEVENFILLATVDGSIYARDRNTGAARWALEVDRPMVETIYHRQNRSSIENYRPEDDFLWIVEPSRDGEIYIFNQGRTSGLQRLRLTVKRLAEDLSPYAGEDPAVVYTAEKKTTLYTIDAGTVRSRKCSVPEARSWLTIGVVDVSVGWKALKRWNVDLLDLLSWEEPNTPSGCSIETREKTFVP